MFSDKDTQLRARAIYSWRTEITKRGYGAFHDMRAIVVAKKREPIVTVIEAGGGMVVDVRSARFFICFIYTMIISIYFCFSPPFEGTVYATHCFLEVKSVRDFSQYIPLAKQGIYCVNTIFISEFLQKTSKDVTDSILPYFNKYLAKK